MPAITFAFIVNLPMAVGIQLINSARNRIEAAIDARRQLREAEDDYAANGSVTSALTLAGQYLQLDRFLEAKTLFQSCAFGCYREHPRLLLGLAQAHFGLHQYQAALDCLDLLQRKWPGRTSAHDQRLYANCLRELGRAQH